MFRFRRWASFIILSTSMCWGGQTWAGKPKVGSAAWKRQFKERQAEFKRRQAEFNREFEAKRAATERRRSQPGSYAHRQASSNARPFHAEAAPSPGDCLKSFRKAAQQATSFEQLLPYVSAQQREHYRLAKSWGSDFDKLGFYQDLLGGIFRIDDVRIDDRPGKRHLAYIDVIRKTGGDFGYSTGRFTMKGEGNRWRMDAYESRFAHNYIPDSPKISPDEYDREGLGYLDVQERRRERARQATEAKVEAVAQPTAEEEAAERPALTAE